MEVVISHLIVLYMKNLKFNRRDLCLGMLEIGTEQTMNGK